jgi:2-oxoglutarate ferredoxin oxidoreductase subunit gamma
MKVRFAGFGGQGVVLMGFILGKAAMFDGKNSIHTQSYGSASRGALTKSDVRIEDGEIHDLICEELDVLVTLSQQSYAAYRPELLDGGQLFFESDLMEVPDEEPIDVHGVGVTDIAYKKFGRKIMANVIMMGFVNEIVGIVTHESLVATIRETVPAGTEDKNVEACEEGVRMARETLGRIHAENESEQR